MPITITNKSRPALRGFATDLCHGLGLNIDQVLAVTITDDGTVLLEIDLPEDPHDATKDAA